MGRKPKYKTFLDGLAVVDKPLHWSSMDVVRKLRNRAGFCKTGHAGTLDPLATGVLIVCFGKGTALVQELMDAKKIYSTRIDLSAFTPTDDAEGERQEINVEIPPDRAAIDEVLSSFIGEVQQRPSAFSAIKINGQAAYKMARRGEDVVMPLRTVQIDKIECIHYAWPYLDIRVHCGKGTYIRSLGRDIGIKLGTGGTLMNLRREAIGSYTIEQTWNWDDIPETILEADLLPLPEQLLK